MLFAKPTSKKSTDLELFIGRQKSCHNPFIQLAYDEVITGVLAGECRWRHPADYALVRLQGPDAVDFLQRLCSQDVARIDPGRGLPAAFLDPKGKLIATCWLTRSEEAVWLETTGPMAGPVVEMLDRYHFSEQLTIHRVTDWVCGEVLGAAAPEVMGVGAGEVQALADGGLAFGGARNGLGWVRYHAPAEFFDAPPWAARQLEEVTSDHAECMPICAGIVAVGDDTERGTLALEAALDDHVSVDKGCYTGQEIVARIHTYGHLNRRLCLLVVDGAPDIELGTSLHETDEGDPVGRAMTSAPLPDGAGKVALGYLPGDFQAAGTELRLGGAEGPRVVVASFGD